MTWIADESSVESSRPFEAIEIATPAVTYRIATGSRDIVIAGAKYTASPASRKEIGVSFVRNSRELTISLPVSHAFSQRYLQGSPPKTIVVTVYRQQPVSGETERIWRGLVTSCAVDGHIASFRVPATSGEALERRLPTVTAGRECPHILYDGNCQVARASFRVTTTVAGVSGNNVTVASVGGNPNQWAQFGELVHLPTGERMTINAQVDGVITMQLPISGLAFGDAIELYAGCAHDIITCGTKFSNVVNYGGILYMPRGNVFLPNGFGVYQSE